MNTFSAAPRLSRSDLWLVAAYWLVVGPILLVQYGADTGWGWARALPVVAATVLFDTVTVCLLVGGLLPLFLSCRHWLGLALLPLFLLLSGWAYVRLYGGPARARRAPIGGAAGARGGGARQKLRPAGRTTHRQSATSRPSKRWRSCGRPKRRASCATSRPRLTRISCSITSTCCGASFSTTRPRLTST